MKMPFHNKCRIVAYISLVLCFTSVYNSLLAQTGSSVSELHALKQYALKHHDKEYVQFDIQYTYSLESSPGKILDSVNGQCRLWGNRFWYRMDSTEAMCDRSIMVVLFREDQLIYLTRPVQNDAFVQSYALIDSLIAGKYAMECRKSVSKDTLHFTIDFLQPTVYKRVEYWISSKSGNILSARQIMKRSAFGNQREDNDNAGEEWLALDVRYANYVTEMKDPACFDISAYVRKTAAGYIPADRFPQYKVFIANSNL